MMDISFERITDTSSPYFNSFEERYLSDFPKKERRELSDVSQLLSDPQSSITIEAILWKGEFAGFISYWMLPSYIFFEHFAIHPTLRSRGIGRKVIKAKQKEFANRPFLIEVEPPTDELKLRRICLYKQLGFVLSDFSYEQPPYRVGELGLTLKLMTWNFNHPITQKDVLELKRMVYDIRF